MSSMTIYYFDSLFSSRGQGFTFQLQLAIEAALGEIVPLIIIRHPLYLHFMFSLTRQYFIDQYNALTIKKY
jgi:hypothetical protein